MTDSASSYNLAVVHELLIAAFSAEGLRRFCQGHPLFQPILANFGPNHSLNQMVDEVIDYCRTYRLLDELVTAIEEENPRQYDRYKDRLLATPAQPLPSPPTPPFEPGAKRFLSRPVVWVLVAALILLGGLGGYRLFVSSPPAPPSVVALKTTHNRYVGAMGADRGWVLMAETEVIDDYEEFTLLCQEDRTTVVLQTWHKTAEGKPRYVTSLGADRDWVLIGETDVILEWEKFTFLDAVTGKARRCLDVVESLKEDGKVRVALQTWHTKDGKHRLVTAMDGAWGWVLRAETTELKASERFTVILLR